jgi:Zn finger protein HypA/HybF involved in hydrogenase expression
MRLLRMGVLGLAGLLTAGIGLAQERPLPAPHIKAKLICHDCHQKEKPTTAAVPDEACMVCHGDYPAMKALTKDAKPNPHAPPQASPHEPYPCTDCHRQHKPPVVKCLECHEGKFTFKIK